MYADYVSLFNSEEEDAISSDEDAPFRDDENDESYDPKYEKCVFWMSRLLRLSTFLLYFYAGKLPSWGADPLLDWQRKKTRVQPKRLQQSKIQI